MNPRESRKLCLEKPLQCSLNALVINSIESLLSFIFSYVCLSLELVGWLENFFFSVQNIQPLLSENFQCCSDELKYSVLYSC